MRKAKAQCLFERFGTHFELGQFCPSYERNLKAIVAEFVVPHVKQSLVHGSTNVATCYWCEGRASEAKQYARRCVKHAKEFFFGRWRKEVPTDLKTCDANWWRIHMTWVTPFREALCWATALSDWTSVQRLAGYPAKESKAGVDATREEAAAFFALACLLRKSPPADYEHGFAIIENGKKAKPKLVAAVIRALQAKHATQFQESLEAYLHYFRRSEFKKSSVDKLLCLDGTTLMNIGVRDGFAFQAPPDVEDYIIRFDR